MIQIGVDFGGTKIEAAALNPEGAFLARIRAPNPGSYNAALRTVQELVQQAESMAGARGTVGIGTPGSISPALVSCATPFRLVEWEGSEC